MMRRPTMAILLVIAGEFGLAVRAAPAQQVLLSDDFDNGASRWHAEGGEWVVKDGVYAQTKDGINAETFAGDEAWVDYTLEASVRVLPSTNRIALLYVRATTQSYYRVELQAAQNMVVLAKVAGAYTPVASREWRVPEARSVRVAVAVKGKVLAVTLNGQTVLRYEDPQPFRAGRIGFATIWTRVEVDDVRVTALKDEPPQALPLSQAAVRDLDDANRYWRLEGPELVGFVSRQTGALEGLLSLRPTPRQLLPADGAGLTVYVENLDTGSLTSLNRLVSCKASRKGSRITCRVCDPQRRAAAATVDYEMLADYLSIRVSVACLASDSSQYQIGVYHGFDPRVFTKQGQFYLSDASIKYKVQYSFHSGMVKTEGTSVAGLPMWMLLGEDRAFVWGYRDLAGHVVLAPNEFPRSAPSLAVFPKGVRKGQTFTFEFVEAVLSAPRHTEPDVYDWYYRRTFASDAELGGRTLRLTQTRSRTILQGLVVGHFLSHTLLGGIEPKERILEWESKLLRRKMTNLWFADWNDWRETAPSQGEWVNANGTRLSAASLRAEIQRLQKRGFRVFLYLRQAWWFKKSEIESKEEVSRPPYKRWLNRNQDGSIKVLWAADWETSDFLRDAAGWDKDEKKWGCEIDFSVDEARRWYTNRVKQCVDTYDPAGIAWDLGWSWLPVAYNADVRTAANPNSDLFKEWLKVQREVYEWLKRKHPEKRVITNFALGAPSQLYCDAALHEEGPFSEDTYVVTGKAMNTGIIAYLEPEAARDRGKLRGDALAGDYHKHILAGLAAGCTWGGNVSGLMEHSPQCQKLYHNYFEQFPFIEQVDISLAHFAALANATPMLTNPRALRIEPDGALGTAWADGTRWLMAVYNGEEAAATVKVGFDLPTLEECGLRLPSRFRVLVYRPDCTLKETEEVAVSSNFLEVPLQPGELATVETPR